MMLNSSEIVGLNLITSGYDGNCLRDAGYDLRIKTLMNKTAEGLVESFTDDIDLTPQGVAAVISEEVLKLPTYICAYASVKTSLCREGVLAINVGVVDPGWEGPLSSLILNFGKDVYRLKAGDTFLRLTFHRVPDMHQATPPPYSRADYEAGIKQKFTKRLASSFMDLDAAAKKGSERFAEDLRNALFKYVPIAAIMLALITLFLNYGVLSIASHAMPFDVVETRAKALVNDLQTDLNKQKEANLELKKEMDQQKLDNEELKKEVEQLKSSRSSH
jgi:deoxycytidine triphosphate deaminase